MIAELNSIEQDKVKIAAEMHDQLFPLLAAVKLKVASFELQDDQDIMQQKKTDGHLNDVILQLRKISFHLMPAALTRKSLKAALQELATQATKNKNLSLQLEIGELFLSEDKSIHVYRIIQEVIQNTEKYAEASQLSLQIKHEAKKTLLIMSDNGRIGTYQQMLLGKDGYELADVFRRVQILEGIVKVNPKKGIGTNYIIEIPN